MVRSTLSQAWVRLGLKLWTSASEQEQDAVNALHAVVVHG